MIDIGSGQLRLNHRFCDNILDTVWHRRLCGVPRYQGQEGTECFQPGSRWVKLPLLLTPLTYIPVGNWCGAFDSDIKDYDITGAIFVNNDGNDLFIAVFTVGFYFGY